VRLAWFSPWPPQHSGVAGRSAELVPLLCARGHAVDVFVDAASVRTTPGDDEPPRAGAQRLLSAHDFVWRHARGQYDLPVYQVGNSHLHRFIWPYLFRYPGLAVLHDGRLHHARAEALLSRGRINDYRAEFAWNHPEVPPGGAEFAVLGFEGAFYYHWPMVRGVVETARTVAAHSRGVADQLALEWPNRPIIHIALGEGPAHLDVAEARRQFRAANGLSESAIVFGVHGGLTEEKRVSEILRAFAATLPWVPNARLLLVGAADPLLGLRSQLAELGLTRAVCHVVSADDTQFDQAIAASDVTLNLRWPTALEVSGPWVRSLALGRATITMDAVHCAYVPALDPSTWNRRSPAADLEPGANERAVTVSLDVRDLNHSLRIAMRRLGTDHALRERLGRHARAWWEQEHTMDRMVADYERAFARAMAEPAPAPGGPRHLRPDPAAHLHHLLDAPAWADSSLIERLARLRT
jgi:glycosyltransferase involved in cell wall biosynthesis